LSHAAEKLANEAQSLRALDKYQWTDCRNTEPRHSKSYALRLPTKRSLFMSNIMLCIIGVHKWIADWSDKGFLVCEHCSETKSFND